MADENTTEVEVETTTAEDNEFETLAQEFTGGEDVSKEETTSELEEPAAHEEESEAEQQETEEPVQTKVEPPAAPTAPEAQPQPAVEPDPKPTPETSSSSGDEETREQFLTRAATQFEAAYKLSDDEAEAVGPELASILPKFASRVVMDIYGQVGRLMKEHVPNMVRNVTQQDLAANELEQKFFESNKDLVAHKNTVTELALRYRQMNPDAETQQMMDEVAALARLKLKLPLQQQVTPPPAPQQKVVRNPPGVSPAPAGAIEQLNEFEQLADELME